MSEVTIIRFDGDNLQTVREGERVWVVVRRVCEALGLHAHGQAEKLKEKPWAVTQLVCATGSDGKSYEMLCIELDKLPMWLATIDTDRVKAEAREKLIAYQRECARVLRDHFYGGRGAGFDLRAVAEVVAEVIGRALAPIGEAISTVAHGQRDLRFGVEELQRQVAWLMTNSGVGGAISHAQHRQLRGEVRSVASLEVASGRHKNRRAATADIDREMGRIVAWGGKGQPWNNLPANLLQPALAVLAGRRRDAERSVCALGARQLHIVGAVGGPKKKGTAE